MVTLKCDFCHREFEERDGLDGLKVCEECDYAGRAGVCMRSAVTLAKNSKGSHVHVMNPIFTGGN